MVKTIRIATRKSRLALIQTALIQEALIAKYPHFAVEHVEITTQGDKIVNVSLAKIGGKGLFVKELEQSLLENKADIAVHSMKDMPPDDTEELTIAAVYQREEPWDAFVSNHYDNYQQLPAQARVGTSSLRRQAQLNALRDDLSITMLRGNVDTRLEKLDRGEFDAIILATAGLKRMQLSHRIKSIFSSDIMLPAAGQGAIAIQCRRENTELIDLLTPLNDPITQTRVMAERAVTKRLGGTCQTPIAAFAEINFNQLTVKAKVLSPDGKLCVKAERSGLAKDAISLGESVAYELLQNGATALLELSQC